MREALKLSSGNLYFYNPITAFLSSVFMGEFPTSSISERNKLDLEEWPRHEDENDDDLRRMLSS